MAEIITLNDALVKKVVAHVFAKYCADVKGAKGDLVPSKTKYKQTSHRLEQQYALIVDKGLIKTKAAELIAYMTPEWKELDSGYQSDAMVAEVATRYRKAGDAGSTLPFSPPRSSFFASANASPSGAAAATASPAATSQHTRMLQLILGELSHISGSLRTIANAAAGGSKEKARISLQNLLSTEASEDEEDSDPAITKSTRGRKRAAVRAKAPPKKKAKAAAAAIDVSSSSSSDEEEEKKAAPSESAAENSIAKEMTAAAIFKSSAAAGKKR